MNRIAAVFGISPVLLPVIHPIGREEALASVAIAHDLGVRGVLFIDQGMAGHEVLSLMHEARERYPALWIGLNLLSRAPAEVLSLAQARCGFIDGIWSDNAGINEQQAGGLARPQADAFVAVRREMRWSGLYFGGVAFKYQREVSPANLGAAAEMSVLYMDVLCTSGPGTGRAAALDKVRALRAGLGDHAMALASGVTSDNVRGYLPYVQAFLVGTGIERQTGILDPVKIKALLRAMQDG